MKKLVLSLPASYIEVIGEGRVRYVRRHIHKYDRGHLDCAAGRLVGSSTVWSPSLKFRPTSGAHLRHVLCLRHDLRWFLDCPRARIQGVMKHSRPSCQRRAQSWWIVGQGASVIRYTRGIFHFASVRHAACRDGVVPIDFPDTVLWQ